MLDLGEEKMRRPQQQVDLGSLLSVAPTQYMHSDCIGEQTSNLWECLNVWVDRAGMAPCGETSNHAEFSCDGSGHEVLCDSLSDSAPFQGWQPYVGHECCWDTPFNSNAEQSWHFIEYGVDDTFARAVASSGSSAFDRVESAADGVMDLQATAETDTMMLAKRSAEDGEPRDGHTMFPDTACGPQKLEDSLSGWSDREEQFPGDKARQGVDRAPSLKSTERLGQPGPAVGETQCQPLHLLNVPY